MAKYVNEEEGEKVAALQGIDATQRRLFAEVLISVILLVLLSAVCLYFFLTQKVQLLFGMVVAFLLAAAAALAYRVTVMVKQKMQLVAAEREQLCNMQCALENALQGDVAELQQAKKQLSNQLLFIKQLLDHIPNLVFYKDTAGRYTGCNKAFEQAFGVTEQQLIGKTVMETEFLPEAERLAFHQDALSALSQQSQTYRQARVLFADRTLHDVLYWLSGFTGTDDCVSGMIGVMVDITELKEKEAALAQAQLAAEEAAAAKAMFLANMSHEIRTPMNAIIGMAYLVLKTELTGKQRDYIHKIHNAATALLGIINDILDFSKIEAGKLQMEANEFVLETVIGDVAHITSPAAYERGLEYLYMIDPDVCPRLVGDPLRLRQILVNLITNAVKFTSQGEVAIQVRQIAQAGKKVQLQFSVRDTGIGIAAEHLVSLFQAFTQVDGTTTRRYGGTGLGLTISKKLVELMGGSIWVTSEVGVGSTFFFTAWFAVAEGMAPVARSLPAQLSATKVLVVDDNAAAREVMLRYLQGMSCQVDAVAAGEEALTVVLKAAQTAPYQVIFMDWKMPGLDGIQTTELINHSGIQPLPDIFIVTAFDLEDVRHRIETQKVAGILIKPINESMLFDAMVHLVVPYDEVDNGLLSEHMQDYGLQGLYVLVAEDNEINQQIARELLTSQGITVDIVENGRLAWERVCQLTEHPYDIVLMDMQMPEMDGVEATCKIRETNQTIPIIAMTARAMEEERELCLQAGMNDHVAKPIDPHVLFSVLAHWGQKQHKLVHPAEPGRPVMGSSLPEIYRGLADVLAVEPALRRVAGNAGLYRRLLQQYAAEQAKTPAQIRTLLDNGQHREALLLAHTLKGVSGNIGAVSLQNLAASLEQALEETQRTAECERLLFCIERELAALITAIAAYLEQEEQVAAAVISAPALPSAWQPASLGSERIAQLQTLLLDDDSEAVTYFEQHRADLAAVLAQDTIAALATALGRYDFATALQQLASIPKRG